MGIRLRMNQLDVGLDKGFSKVNLVVVDADQQILREAHIERIDRTGRLISDRRLLQLIAQHLIPFRAYQLEQTPDADQARSEEHTSELQSPDHLVSRLLLEK